MARKTIVPLALYDDVEFEAAFLADYQAQPRARRQEWLRNILRKGYQSETIAGHRPVAAPAAPRPKKVKPVPVEAAHGLTTPVAPAPSLPTRPEPMAPQSPASVPAAPKPKAPVAPVSNGNASVLKGFLDDV